MNATALKLGITSSKAALTCLRAGSKLWRLLLESLSGLRLRAIGDRGGRCTREGTVRGFQQGSI
jgi:hypothetical protein